jgi:hypothetical protein
MGKAFLKGMATAVGVGVGLVVVAEAYWLAVQLDLRRLKREDV